MIASIISAVLSLFVSGISMYLDKKAKDEQSMKDYLAFVEIMERNGLASVKMRLAAHDQVERIKKLWEAENGTGPE